MESGECIKRSAVTMNTGITGVARERTKKPGFPGFFLAAAWGLRDYDCAAPRSEARASGSARAAATWSVFSATA